MSRNDIKPRSWQEAAFNTINQAIADSNHSLIVVNACVGTGKTIVGIEAMYQFIIKHENGITFQLFVCPRIHLCNQQAKAISDYFKNTELADKVIVKQVHCMSGDVCKSNVTIAGKHVIYVICDESLWGIEKHSPNPNIRFVRWVNHFKQWISDGRLFGTVVYDESHNYNNHQKEMFNKIYHKGGDITVENCKCCLQDLFQSSVMMSGTPSEYQKQITNITSYVCSCDMYTAIREGMIIRPTLYKIHGTRKDWPAAIRSAYEHELKFNKNNPNAQIKGLICVSSIDEIHSIKKEFNDCKDEFHIIVIHTTKSEVTDTGETSTLQAMVDGVELPISNVSNVVGGGIDNNYFGDNKPILVFQVDMLGEGINVNSFNWVITSSKTSRKSMQQIGRVLRHFKDDSTGYVKTYAHIFAFSENNDDLRRLLNNLGEYSLVEDCFDWGETLDIAHGSGVENDENRLPKALDEKWNKFTSLEIDEIITSIGTKSIYKQWKDECCLNITKRNTEICMNIPEFAAYGGNCSVKDKLMQLQIRMPLFMYITNECQYIAIDDILNTSNEEKFKLATDLSLDCFKQIIASGIFIKYELEVFIRSYNQLSPDGKLNCLQIIDARKGLVFTSERIVNMMLDMFPKEIWSDKNMKFCCIACKSGIFAKEIYKRLNIGLKDVIIDDIERKNWILTKMLYGIALNELCQVISSTTINCKNIVLDENEFKGMKFDVIIGNPPYQELCKNNVDTAKSKAKNIFPSFIQNAIKNATYVSMIVPAKWFCKKTMKKFRKEFLHNNHIQCIHDFPNTSECFKDSDVRIGEGVMYFLYNKEYSGKCEFNYHLNDQCITYMNDLSKYPVIIRNNVGYLISQKIQNISQSFMNNLLMTDPFKISSSFDKYVSVKDDIHNIKLIKSYGERGFVSETQLYNAQYTKTWNVYAAKAGGDGLNACVYPLGSVIPDTFYDTPGACCTQSYLVVAFDTEIEAKNCSEYLNTKFVKFLLSLVKMNQNGYPFEYSMVPVQDFTEEWTDEKLYKKYNLSQSEIDYIEWAIRDRK